MRAIEIVVSIEGQQAVAAFWDNCQIPDAIAMLVSAAPKQWKQRKRLKYTLAPIDRSYGDPLAPGVVSVRWGSEYHPLKVRNRMTS